MKSKLKLLFIPGLMLATSSMANQSDVRIECVNNTPYNHEEFAIESDGSNFVYEKKLSGDGDYSPIYRGPVTSIKTEDKEGRGGKYTNFTVKAHGEYETENLYRTTLVFTRGGRSFVGGSFQRASIDNRDGVRELTFAQFKSLSKDDHIRCKVKRFKVD